MIESFTVDTFEPYLGETFSIRHGEGESGEPLATTLIEAQALGSAAGRRDPFSIVFRAPPGVMLAQGVYQIDHAAIGTFELFIVPIGPDGVGLCYQAIFG